MKVKVKCKKAKKANVRKTGKANAEIVKTVQDGTEFEVEKLGKTFTKLTNGEYIMTTLLEEVAEETEETEEIIEEEE